ncbi:MAG: hypothetical protein IKB01_00570, partial [Lachnospiraceae bacterium]|nr:hypothetical protein [Lachnospiraceae bacterium]
MRTKLILTALLFAVLSFAKAQTLNVRGTFKAGQVQELGLMLAPFGSASSEAITKMTPQDTIFTGSVLASDNGFYTLYGAYNGGQLIMPLYLPDTTTTHHALRAGREDQAPRPGRSRCFSAQAGLRKTAFQGQGRVLILPLPLFFLFRS